MLGHDLPEALDQFLAAHERELIAFRRDLHAHPELGHQERRTTDRVARRLGHPAQGDGANRGDR
jgi:amidohydrolase